MYFSLRQRLRRGGSCAGRRRRAGRRAAAKAAPRRAPREAPELRGTRLVVANFWQNFARFRLYRHRSLQENTRFSAFFKSLPDYR